MKRISIFAAITALLFVAVFFCSCGKGNEEETTTTELVISMPWSEADVFEMPTEALTQVESDDPFTQTATTAKSDSVDSAAVWKRIAEAHAVYELFNGSKPQMDKTAGVEYNGIQYYPITDPNFASMEKLIAFLGQYFSEDVVRRLTASGMYVEIEEGKLFAPDISIRMEKPDYLNPKVEVVEQSDTEQVYRLTLDKDVDHDGKADETITRNYTYSYNKDAKKWVFTHFELY